MASISRLLKIIGLFCKRALQKRLYSAKETYDFKEPTNRSHPIAVCEKMGSYVCVCVNMGSYGVATISRLLKIIGFFCRI